ncbi:type II secretion system protein GspD [Desulfurivibrio sp. D14AmB]|uniref:type II secretion system protein GspD n=1 Tax=Desulfurivibrio sp. D14AmB TaxID=3374370 RepID=UPI00376F069B
MQLKSTFTTGILLMSTLALGLSACASKAPEQPVERAAPAAVEAPTPVDSSQLPARFQRPTYQIQATGPATALTAEETPSFPVGADISSTTGPVPLRDILRRLAAMKKMNVSWASDVDRERMVDVDIQAEDDFFEAIDNLLRQVDYFHELQRNTIVVKYRETKRFQIPMPATASTYSSAVGGDVLGAGGGSGSLEGNIKLTSNDNRFDIWENIRQSLDQLLGIWEETVPLPAADGEGTPGSTTRRNVQGGKGYYNIDRHIGQITVTAPRPLVQQIEAYLDSLQTQLFRQVTIEAKIIEVALGDEHKTGIDWSGVLSGKFLNFEIFGPNGIIYPWDAAGSGVTQTTIGPNPFQLLMDAIEEQGQSNVLANPRISVLNGQPAMITVGETFSYIAEVTTTVTDGVATQSVTTETVMSGLGLAVLPVLTGDNEIVLNLTPITSNISNIDERSFAGLTVQLPTISIRELNTIVRIKSGDTLMIGGLIDNQDRVDSTRVPVLGSIPFLGRLFRHDAKGVQKKELVILLQPRII